MSCIPEIKAHKLEIHGAAHEVVSYYIPDKE